MAGEISTMAGANAVPLPARVTAPPARTGKHPAAGRQAGLPPEAIGEPGSGYPEDRVMLAALMERAHKVGTGNTTSVAFERDSADGQMYLHVKDKYTGQDLYRIPKKYLEDRESEQKHRLDVKI